MWAEACGVDRTQKRKIYQQPKTRTRKEKTIVWFKIMYNFYMSGRYIYVGNIQFQNFNNVHRTFFLFVS